MKCQGVAWVLLLAGFVACGGGTALDDYDPMTSPGDGDGGTAPQPCAHCFEDSCAWQTSECASDPSCARWLTCARDCAAGNDDTPAASCLDACEAPSALQGQRFRDALESCFLATGGCCNVQHLDPDASKLDGGESLDASKDAPYAPMACSTDSCEGCLLAMKDGKPCVSDDAICPGLLADCYHENDPNGPRHCLTFLTAYGQCATGVPSPDGGPCSYEVPASSVETTEGSMACAARHCPSCMPEPLGVCVSCQLAACPDEMRALMRSAAAQDILWCRSSCDGSADPAACKQDCLEGNEDLVPTLDALLGCTQQACGSSCTGVL